LKVAFVRFVSLGFILLLMLTGCNSQRGQTPDMIPTSASFEGVATAQALTAAAPPEGFRESVSFPEIDANLNALAGGRYTVQLEFDGVFSRTPRQTTAKANAEVWFNLIGSSRRIVVQTQGELIGQQQDNAFEAVRLAEDSFLLIGGTCTSGDATSPGGIAARLSAGSLIGGVSKAVPAGRKAVINGEEVWAYTFSADALNLPSIRPADNGKVELEASELWVAPKHNAVVRYYVTLDVTNTIIFDRQLPVDGQVILRYDLYDVGQTTNITVPNGC
jgi:hypothetical protein